MRFTSILALVFATGSLAAPFNPRSSAQCSADNQNFVDNLTCPTIQALQGLLNYQGASVGTFTRDTLTQVNRLLVSDDPVSLIAQGAFNGAALGLTQGITFTLQTVAATIPQLNPDCRCNLVACNNGILAAQQQCNVSPQSGELAGNAQTSCGQTLFTCAGFYSRDQINQMTGCCSRYGGVSNS